MTLDTRRESLQARQKVVDIRGMYVRPAFRAITASDIAVIVEGGLAIVGDHVQQFAADEYTVRVGDTLAASSEGYSALVAYYNPEVDGVFVIVVDGTEALTSAGAAEVTDAEIEAALPNEDYEYTVLAMVKSRTSAGSVVTVGIDHRARSLNVPTGSESADAYHQDHLANGGVYKPHSTVSFSIDAADIANGDLLTAYPLPLIDGRIRAWRAVTEKAITTAAKTTIPNLEINTTNVTGSDSVTYAGIRTLGAVVELGAPTALNTFKPGDTVSIECASTTAFTEGRVRFEIDIDELVLGQAS